MAFGVQSLIPQDMLDDLKSTQKDMKTMVKTLGRIEKLLEKQNELLEQALRVNA